MKRSAELVWIEAPSGRYWVGRLLNSEAIDRHTGQRARLTARIADRSPGGLSTVEAYELMTRGAHPGSTRYRTFDNLTDAQMAGVAWARRRFYMEVPA